MVSSNGAAGVTTAIAIQFVTKYLEDRAILAARAEVEKLMMSFLSPTNTQESNTNFPSNTTTLV